jgi:hypothetical protein
MERRQDPRSETVRLPRLVADELAAYLIGRPHRPDDLVFTAPRGGPLRETKFVPGRFRPAVLVANEAISALDDQPGMSGRRRRLFGTRVNTEWP